MIVSTTYLAKNIGKKGTARYSFLPCSLCGIERWVEIRHGEPRSSVCSDCRYLLTNKSRKGGKNMNQDYVSVWLYKNDFFAPMITKRSLSKRGGYVFEHRLVMAKHLGRCLQPWELVHHKGIRYTGIENKSDNLIDNLKLTTRGSHMREHQTGYRNGYRQGYQDAQNTKMKELLEHIKLLEWHLKEAKHQQCGAEQ